MRRKLVIHLKKAVVGAVCALLLLAPVPASAGVTITFEVAGGVVACGLGFLFYFGGSWEASLADRGLQGTLLELSDGRVRLGVPVPSLNLVSDPAGEEVAHEALQLDLLRWRF